LDSSKRSVSPATELETQQLWKRYNVIIRHSATELQSTNKHEQFHNNAPRGGAKKSAEGSILP